MLLIILLTCTLLIWTLIILHQINHRGFLILIIWLFIAPLVSGTIQKVTSEPDPQNQIMAELQDGTPVKKVFLSESKIRLKDLLEPTRILFGLFLFLFLINALLKKDRPFNLDKTEVYMTIFSIFLVANVILMSKRPMFGLRTACDAFIIPFVGYFVTRRLVTGEERFLKLTKVIGYMSLYVVIIALIERISHQELLYRLSGPFPTANTLYAVLAVIFFIILAESYNKGLDPGNGFISSPFLRKIVLYSTPVIIFLTLGRGNWVGILSGLCVFIFMARRLTKFSTKIFAVGVILLFLCAMTVTAPLILPEDLLTKRIGNTTNIYARIGAWLLILNEGLSQPVLGIGLHNLRHFLDMADLSGWSNGLVRTAHNSFLALTTELGIVGLLMYAAVILSIGYTGLSLYRRGATTQDKWRGVALTSILIAYLMPAMFANTLYIDTPLHHVYVYAYAGAIAALHNRRRFFAELWRKRSFMAGDRERARGSTVEIAPSITPS
jgi:O-antigen ligase